eukprot:SAG11_NODE_106_length_16423_cov_51.220840_20_plen_65_part_00
MFWLRRSLLRELSVAQDVDDGLQSNRLYALFAAEITLTDEGFARWEDVVGAVCTSLVLTLQGEH